MFVCICLHLHLINHLHNFIILMGNLEGSLSQFLQVQILLIMPVLILRCEEVVKNLQYVFPLCFVFALDCTTDTGNVSSRHYINPDLLYTHRHNQTLTCEIKPTCVNFFVF